MVARRAILQGDVWWASLREPGESEPGFRRPVLVVQQTPINASTIQTIIAVVITSNLRLANAPGNVALPAAKTGLPKASVANVTQLITLDKTFLQEYMATVPDKLLNQVLDGIQYILGR